AFPGRVLGLMIPTVNMRLSAARRGCVAHFRGDLAPEGELALEMRRQILRTAGEDLDAYALDPRRDGGLGDRVGDVGVEATNDGSRCPGWCQYARPLVHLESGKTRLRDGRNTGQHRHRLRRGHAER